MQVNAHSFLPSQSFSHSVRLSFPISPVLLAPFLPQFLFPVPIFKISPLQLPILPAWSILLQCSGAISFLSLILSPVSLLWLLLFSHSTVRLASSLATMPGYPAENCNYISRAAAWDLVQTWPSLASILLKTMNKWKDFMMNGNSKNDR